MRIKKYDTRLTEDRLPMLVQESRTNYKAERKEFRTPESICKYLCETEEIDSLTNEKVFMLCFDTRMCLIGTFELSQGTVSSAILSTRDIFMRALAVGASGIVCVHNHPAGSLTPSTEDKNIYRKITDAGNLMDIPLEDFLIIGSCGSWYSCKTGDRG